MKTYRILFSVFLLLVLTQSFAFSELRQLDNAYVNTPVWDEDPTSPGWWLSASLYNLEVQNVGATPYHLKVYFEHKTSPAYLALSSARKLVIDQVIAATGGGGLINYESADAASPYASFMVTRAKFNSVSADSDVALKKFDSYYGAGTDGADKWFWISDISKTQPTSVWDTTGGSAAAIHRGQLNIRIASGFPGRYAGPYSGRLIMRWDTQ